MAHAWLDSLSEDWVSQPESETSQPQLPKFSSPTRPDPNQKTPRRPVSRIPRVCNARPTPRDSSAHVLSERSPNDTNVRGLQRDPSKFSPLLKKSQRGRYLSRSASASTSASVVHNTVQHNKSQSASPAKTKENIPEWKRRLVYGELNYGETKDLFSSAGTGLENVFRPPVAADTPAEETLEDQGNTPNETTLPSSPPPYSRTSRYQTQADESEEQSTNESSAQPAVPQPRPVVFRRTEDDTEEPSPEDYSTFEEGHDGQDIGTNELSNNSIASLNANQQHLDASRKISGQSDIRNEDLSPILISRHNSGDGKVSFAPVELPAQQLRKRLEMLRRNQMLLDSEPGSNLDQEPATVNGGSQKFNTTDDFVRNGGFINFRRGGRSAEDSFRRRPLSPSLGVDTSEMLPESSLQASTPKQFPTVRIDRYASADRKDDPQTPNSPVVPRAPHPSPEKRLQPTPGHSGSPLKLFGPYDTFTNQTLLRRISQFEDQMTEGQSAPVQDESLAVPTRETLSNSGYEQSQGAASNSEKAQQVSYGYQETIDAVNNFGSGELDDYKFSEDITLNSADRSQYTDKENVAPEDNLMPPSQALKFDLHRDFSAEGESLIIQRRRHKSSTSGSSRHTMGLSKTFSSSRPQTSRSTAPNNGIQATPKRDSLESKRPRSTPSKDPTPKRRRTLHRSDIAYGLEDRRVTIESVQSSHRTMQSAIGRGRIDDHQGNFHQIADPRILATRQILRPRSPTPSQKSSVTRERQRLVDLDFNSGDHSGVSKRARESEVSVQDFAVDGSRKTSMKTQEFFDAAEEIMAMIRSKARFRNDRGSVEESEATGTERRSLNETDRIEESYQESTKEPFSRPPSREGAPMIRMPIRQDDPELADRLKQYEERSELDGIITNSIHPRGSITKITNEASNPNEAMQQGPHLDETQSGLLADQEVISDLPNVRITRNPNDPEPGDNVIEFPSNRSRSSGTSTGRSIPTNSSRGSDSKRLIGPDVVSQLIGDQVGNMVFDKDHNVWFKVKPPRPTSKGGNILPSEDSEDPFASIPDLSVDTIKETRNPGSCATEHLGGPGAALNEETPLTGPSTTVQGSSDARSIVSHTKETFTRVKQTLVETAVEDDEEIEHEITIHEDRMQRSSPSRRKHLNISFSSPIASIIQDVAHQKPDDNVGDEGSGFVDERVGNLSAGSLKRGRDAKLGGSVNGSTTKSKSRSRSRGLSRNLSVKGEAFIPRPVSRIDEQDEDTCGEHDASEQRQVSNRGDSSIVYPEGEDKRNTSVSVIITTPAPMKTMSHSATPIIGQYVGTLSLSPMSEFTMHKIDQSCALEVSYVVGDQYLTTGDGSKKIMSRAIRSLVEKITEVEPFEPEWDSLDELDISGKKLTTLHMLDEFCSSVVTLDASDNSLEHLDGVPASVRNLRMTQNHLSELTAWGHLTNLQYVDVSNNQISSLHAFKDLVHLRTLRADNNQITSLDGIKLHDSLQVLRARGNLIENVNLDGTRMCRLTELDLEGNQISSIQGIEQVPCLTTLNLEHNRLVAFAPSTKVTVPNLKYLKLSSNDLTSLDLAAFPALRLLYVDRNQLTTVTGFSKCRRLDSLSLREQQHDTPFDASSLDAAYEVRKIFLSGNLLTGFNPRVDFLNLQYLELASCGLESLPPELGQLMPNLRVLNLNHNALSDLAPLRYIPRLKKLFVAGNRLANAARVVDVLAGFPHLARLDLRDNLATHGFYPPLQTLVPAEAKEGEGTTTTFDPFMLPDADPERDGRFARRGDIHTRMRRRLYEIIVLGRCGRLKVLDGLPVDKAAVVKQDAVWDALVASGIVEAGKGEQKDTMPEGEGGEHAQ